MELLIGRSIGKYRILGEIGRGTVGNVYRAYDPDLDRDVAIKVLASRNTWDQKFVQDFLQRARLTTRLQHPNLVTVYDLGQREGWYCVVMELLEGISLHDLVRLRGGLLLDEVWAITRQLAGALDYIHGAGLIHGDVRTGNAILTPPDRVVLTELGVVRTSWEGRIATGAATAAVAPEQVSGAQMGPWTDLYSLGVVVYELLTAKPPFAAETVPTLLHQVLHQAAPPPTAVRPDLPPAVDQVLQRALAKDPQLRYNNGAELSAALETLAGAAHRTEPNAAPPSPTLRGSPAPPAADEPAPLVLSTVSDAAPAEGRTLAPPPAPYAGTNGPATAGNSPAPAAPQDSLRPRERRAFPAQEAPPWAAPTTARPIVPLPHRPQRPAERQARSSAIITRIAPVPQPTEEPPAEPSEEPPAKRRPPAWMWAALGVEALILLVGVVLLILLLRC